MNINIKKIVQFIFSIKNASASNHKIITIFGIKIKIKNFNFYRIKKNRIVFINFYGKGYGCNPKYITQCLLKENKSYEIIWLTTNTNMSINNIPSEAKVVKYNVHNGIKYLSGAAIWINNTRNNIFYTHGLKKKKNQLYIQTWHGSLGFKKIEKDIENNKLYENYLKIAQKDSQYIDYLLSPSKFDTKCLKNCFYYDGKILEIGYPRNDIFFYNNEKKAEIINKIKNYYNIDSNKKLAIYVPTFRDSYRIDLYNIESQALCQTLKEKFNSEWELIVRLHPKMLKQSHELSSLLNNTINATSYPDLQELLLASDLLITDYSSAIWDFCLQDKPAFVYATDIDDYTKERDFYVKLEELPFLIAENQDELFKNIKNCNISEYILSIRNYMNLRGHFDDGNASDKVVEIINKYINN